MSAFYECDHCGNTVQQGNEHVSRWVFFTKKNPNEHYCSRGCYRAEFEKRVAEGDGVSNEDRLEYYRRPHPLGDPVPYFLLPEHMTIGEKYGPAMSITDAKQAGAYLRACVRHTIKYTDYPEYRNPVSADSLERQNFGYYSGYYSPETQDRVKRLFIGAAEVVTA